MKEIVILQLIYIGRIAAAGICGILIGWERQKRIKAAGIKTHFVIAVASALMVIVSKYGFIDAAVSPGASVDVSRVAAGILAGVGLMGGGLVISGKQGFTSGITTAAGIWATVAIGMAIGAGMYAAGLCTTMILLLGQMIFHKNVKLAKGFWHGQIDFIIHGGEADIQTITSRLEESGINVLRIKCEIQNSKTEKVKVIFAVPTKKERAEVVKLITDIPQVHSYEF
ncbi:MAG: MgtC/SapB family protein [Lachnospiraceae bacterium]|nr:MgtC/SapB family protein [Lachnospiraceae bacterium]